MENTIEQVGNLVPPTSRISSELFGVFIFSTIFLASTKHIKTGTGAKNKALTGIVIGIGLTASLFFAMSWSNYASLNPAITISSVFSGKMSYISALKIVLAQIIGAIAANYAINTLSV